MKKAFTLIELLVVIAVMAVIASAVLVLIDPVDKLNSANDSRTQADVGQVASAMTAYAASHNGLYPTTAQGSAELTTSGEMSKLPSPPTGYSAYIYTFNAAGTIAQISGQVKSKKYVNATPSTPFWGWCNSSAAAGAVTGSAVCPP